MKKILALILAMALVLGLAACGAAEAPETEANTAADFKVGAIYINSKNDTAGYTFAHHNGITTAMKELGLNPETQLVIVDEVPEDKEQVLAAVDTLVGEGVGEKAFTGGVLAVLFHKLRRKAGFNGNVIDKLFVVKGDSQFFGNLASDGAASAAKFTTDGNDFLFHSVPPLGLFFYYNNPARHCQIKMPYRIEKKTETIVRIRHLWYNEFTINDRRQLWKISLQRSVLS